MTSNGTEDNGDSTPALNYEDSLAITREIYWVGFMEEGGRLRCNPYLLIDGRGQDVILFDPGSIPDFPKIMRKGDRPDTAPEYYRCRHFPPGSGRVRQPGGDRGHRREPRIKDLCPYQYDPADRSPGPFWTANGRVRD